ncbi:hypothetical protein CAL7716_101940 (plasmid) [Calothrix sp. PCC 7716]|nr:hypothetical protein CAL7716_101940 [Calothrix sp. PCC 7716]
MLTEERKISELSLRELSLDAVKLWQEIEEAQLSAEEKEDKDSNRTNDVGLVIQKLMENQGAIEAKVDAIVWVKEKLEAELVGWKARMESALKLYESAIQVRESAISEIKAMLLHLHSVGLIPEKNIGKECEIEIRQNPPKVASIVMDVESEEFPPQFKKVTTSPDSKAILEAYKLGIDISPYAEITIGEHVRFKIKKSKQK